jgi:hypothetical protein
METLENGGIRTIKPKKITGGGAENPNLPITPPHAAGFHVIITNEPNFRGFVALFTMKLAT